MAAAAVAEAEVVEGQWAGSAEPLADSSEAPDGYPIKGNAGSMLFHEPGSRYYKATKAEVWFDSVESAEAAGFAKPGTTADAGEAESTEKAAEGSASDEAGDSADRTQATADAGEAESTEKAAEGSASDEAGDSADQPEAAGTDGEAEEN